MSWFNKLFTSRWGPAATGLVVGVIAPILVTLGNPGNMGICVVCFTRDIAGAIGLQRAATVQYIRPEIIGLMLGAMVAAMSFREFKPRTGSSPLVLFLLGMFAVFGALVFLGCPWRAYLRLGGGDWNAIAGIAGLAAGIGVGAVFLKMGFSLGPSRPAPKALGYVMPAIMVVLLALLILQPQFGRDANGNAVGPIFLSTTGPGSLHAPIIISLAAGLILGFLAQRSRFCTVGAIRDVILVRDFRLFWGVVVLILAAFVTNLLLGQFHPGITGQPIAQTNQLWNFGGMVLAGLAFTLAGGCPGRQLFLAGEGSADAAVFVLGMLVGAGIGHTYNMTSSTSGPGIYGPAIVIAGIIVCSILGLTMRTAKTA